RMKGKEDARIEELARLKKIIVAAVSVGCSSLLLIIFISITTQLSVQRIHSVLEEDLRFCRSGNDKIDEHLIAAYQISGVERRKRDTGYTSSNATQSDANSTVVDKSTKDVNVTVVAPVVELAKDVKAIVASPLCSCGIGAAGDMGPPGEDGNDGPDGSPGSDGAAGADYEGSYKGVAEEWCTTCPQAPAGQRGRPGSNGSNGRPGAVGGSGRNGIPGNRGKPGYQGQAGPPGYTGSNGQRGPNGLVVRVNGPFGMRGIPGMKGEMGRRGDNGQNGLDGRDGKIGEEGEPGNRGNRGRDGSDGARGWNGRPGAEGSCSHCVRQKGVRRPVVQYSHQSNHVSYSTSGSSPYTTANPPAAEPPTPNRRTIYVD
ncbi:hypothetical protein PENTCL1PPCAC_6338, partial [Pristionchus entomophagus]